MGLNKLFALAAALTVLVASTGQLPRIIRAVHLAQFQLIKESQASKWPKAALLPQSKPCAKERR